MGKVFGKKSFLKTSKNIHQLKTSRCVSSSLSPNKYNYIFFRIIQLGITTKTVATNSITAFAINKFTDYRQKKLKF